MGIICMKGVTLELLHKEISSLKREIEELKSFLIPEVEISSEELAALERIDREIDEGKFITIEKAKKVLV